MQARNLEKLEKKIFSTHEMAVILNYKGSVKNLNTWIKRLKDRGLVQQVKKGYYALAQEEINKFEYSNILYAPSYISLDSALNYYGIIPQVPLSTTAITLKRAKLIDHEGIAYEYFHISPKYYWGYENIGNTLIADREKSLVDKVYFESFKSDAKAGFLDELNLEDVSKEKLLSYASKIQNKAFNKLFIQVFTYERKGCQHLLRCVRPGQKRVRVKVYVVITSFNEPATIGKAVEQIICPNVDKSRELWPSLQLVVVAPDQPTLEVAEKVCQQYQFENVRLVKDSGQGKPTALNIAVGTITKGGVSMSEDDLLILTDGDVYLENNAIRSVMADRHPATTVAWGGVGGHPVSVDSRQNMFGYFSHLFCEAAHVRRRDDGAVPMSGYLCAIRGDLLSQIFPIPAHIRAEDAYISQKILSLGYKIAYAPDALVYVKFPKNLSDWYKQKTRSLGGNVQVSSSRRSVIQDLQMMFFPLLFAKSPKEFLWSLLLYPLRLFLWIKIYYNHALKHYKSGAWDRIESSK